MGIVMGGFGIVEDFFKIITFFMTNHIIFFGFLLLMVDFLIIVFLFSSLLPIAGAVIHLR
jgi:hypothetical protein